MLRFGVGITLSLTLAVSLALGPDLLAQANAEPAAANDGVALLSGQIELVRLIDLAAAQNGASMEYDASVLKGSATLRMDGALDSEGLWTLLNRVLVQRGFTTVRLPDPFGRRSDLGQAKEADRADTGRSVPVYSVIRLQEASSLVTPLSPAGVDARAIDPHDFVRTRRLFPGDGEHSEPRPGFASVVVRVQHISAREAVDAAGRVLSKPGGSAVTLAAGTPRMPMVDQDQAGPSGGLILIADLTPRLERALELLAVIDVPGAQAAIEEHPARFLPAHQLATLAMLVAAKRDAVWGGSAAAGAGAVSERTPGEVMASPDGASVLIVSPRDRVEWWRTLIDRLDKREPVSVATYRPRHFPAADVANLIEQTVRDFGIVTAGSGAGAGPGAGGGGGRDDRWRLVVDDLTGSLIITATPAQHAAITDLIARLDSTPAAARRPVRSFVIKNRSVSEVRSILEQLIQAGVLQAGADDGGSRSSGMNGTSIGASAGAVDVTPFPPPPRPDPILSGADAAGSSRALANTDPGSSVGTRSSGASPSSSRVGNARLDQAPELVLTVDEGTNTLIAVGEPRLLAQIESLLLTIDVRQPQVMLEVLLVTLSEAQTMDLGIELEQLILSGDLRIRLSSLFGLGMRGAGGDRTGPDNASGFTGVVLSPGDFSVVIRALQTLNNGRSVSMPKLLVGNNQSATINSVLQQPFASVNASNTVSTTSFGGTQDAGTVVTVRPQIAEGDHLVMDYSVSLSSFVGSSSSATLPPPRQQNQVRSVATIPDGYTVVVGGIELETDSKSVSQVPLIGDIPVIGEAFKTRSKSGTRSKFFVFIRANVLRGRGFEDLKFLSDRDAVRADVQDGFPVVRPRIIR